jgi:hypothetical protein
LEASLKTTPNDADMTNDLAKVKASIPLLQAEVEQFKGLIQEGRK